MALKIGRLEIGYRLLISLIAIAIGYGYLGSYICLFWLQKSYWITSSLFLLATSGIFAMPRSLGGLIAAIAAIVTIYINSSLTDSLIGGAICLFLYWVGFQDIRYNSAPNKKLSIIDLLATAITIALMIFLTIATFQIPLSWLASLAIGVMAAAVTLIGKQIEYIELSTKANFIIIGILTGSSLAIGFAIRIIFYLPKPEISL
jgi:hypothetical protein